MKWKNMQRSKGKSIMHVVDFLTFPRYSMESYVSKFDPNKNIITFTQGIFRQNEAIFF